MVTDLVSSSALHAIPSGDDLPTVGTRVNCIFAAVHTEWNETAAETTAETCRAKSDYELYIIRKLLFLK